MPERFGGRSGPGRPHGRCRVSPLRSSQTHSSSRPGTATSATKHYAIGSTCRAVETCLDYGLALSVRRVVEVLDSYDDPGPGRTLATTPDSHPLRVRRYVDPGDSIHLDQRRRSSIEIMHFEREESSVRLYAKPVDRRNTQIAGDIVGVVWTLMWIGAAVIIYRAVASLAEALRSSAAGGNSFADSLHNAAGQAAQVPLVGKQLSAPIASAGDSASGIAANAYQAADSLVHAGLMAGIALALGPILLYWLGWLPRRVRFVRDANARQRFFDASADLQLFALRALAGQPVHVLARISADPVGGWRAGDQRIITELAALELRASGLDLPTSA